MSDVRCVCPLLYITCNIDDRYPLKIILAINCIESMRYPELTGGGHSRHSLQYDS